MLAQPRQDSPDRTLARSSMLLGILLWCVTVMAASGAVSGLLMAALDARERTDDLDGLGVVLGLGLAAISTLLLAACGPWAPGVLRGRGAYLAGEGADGLHQASFAAACAHGALCVLYGWAAATYVPHLVWLWLPGAVAELVVLTAAVTTAARARRAMAGRARRTAS